MVINICDELKQNFIDYTHEVNSQRAFPEAADGLKPGQRACLWTMYDSGFLSSKPHVKSAKVSGKVISEFWPHGDTAIYETFGRMSQEWINNIPEVDWHGANGNVVIGQALASQRYTECRLNKPIEEGMFTGIKKNNVPMILNFSEDLWWPKVLPAIFPRLMINGSQGIGSTLAQSWLPNSLGEVTEVIEKYLREGVLDYSNLAPDFPTGGIIINKKDIPEIYATGKGKIILRGKVNIEGNLIVITELPYQVYVEPLLEEIRALVEKEEITGIDEIYNKTNRKGLRVEIKCDGNIPKILNTLYSKTSLQKTYHANQVALTGGKTPRLLNLKEYLDVYIEHNLECIKRENEYDLEKAEARLEILDGLLIALAHIDEIIALIKQSETSSAAKENLQKKYNLSEVQAKSIVDMKLGKLAKLESIEINTERTDLIKATANYKAVIESKNERVDIFLTRLLDFTHKYGAERKTEVLNIDFVKEKAEKVEEETKEYIVTISEGGQIKAIPKDSYKPQRKSRTSIKSEKDIIKKTIKTDNKDNLLVFTNAGKLYRLPVGSIPEATNKGTGASINNLLPLEIKEKVNVICSANNITDNRFILFVTKKGLIKKTVLSEYTKTTRKGGVPAISLNKGDEIASVTLIDTEDVLIFTELGMGIRFSSLEVGASGKNTKGVKGIDLKDGDAILTCLPVEEAEKINVFNKEGLVHSFSINDISKQRRGGKGLIVSKSPVADVILTKKGDSLLITGVNSSKCLDPEEIPLGKRVNKGVIAIKDVIVNVTKF